MNNTTSKVCKFCKQEVGAGATKCPHCRSDLRSWFRRHFIITGILGFILFSTTLSALTDAFFRIDNAVPTASATGDNPASPGPEVKALSLYERLKKLDDGRVFETPYALGPEKTCDELFKATMINGSDLSTVKEGLASASSTEKILAQKLKQETVSRDIHQKPQARKICAERLKTSMWEHDVDVALSGSGNTTLTFTGAIFASNQGIKSVHETGIDSYKNLGFKRINYKWYRDASEFTYFNIEDTKIDGSMFK